MKKIVELRYNSLIACAIYILVMCMVLTVWIDLAHMNTMYMRIKVLEDKFAKIQPIERYIIRQEEWK